MRRSYVKKAAALALALVMALLLPGCGVEGSAWQDTPVVPQKNDSLTVLCLGQQTKAVSMVQMALKLYQAMYPEVEVELIQSGANDTLEMDDERYRQIAAQIMAGEGPDVFIVDDAIMDVEKLVRQGVFADMEPFFEADNFDWEPYNQAVMDGGVWNGKRFIIPLNYSFPVLVTTRSVLEETGIDPDACGDIQGFLEENTRYLESEGRTRQLICGAKPFRSLLDESGLAIADYDARTIDLSSPVLKSLLRWNKTIIETDSDWDLSVAGGLTAAAAVRDGAKVWAGSAVVPQTNESLTVFCLGDDAVQKKLQLALERYRQMYPDVEVELIKPVYDMGNYEMEDELYQQVAAQIMAGSGPDIFIVDDAISDVEKLVRQGVFADMEPYFQADNFDWEPYNQAVMDGGVWNGKRFLIPLTYSFPLLFTSRTALEETGFDVEACGDYQGFLEETTRFMEDETQTRQLFRKKIFITDIVEDSGLTIADYDTRTVDLSSPLFKAGNQWRKTVAERCPYDYNDSYDDAGLYGAAAVRDGDVLWTVTMQPTYGFYTEFSALKTIGEAVMMPVRDINGGIQAQIGHPLGVRANSENLQNAYNYIKILLGFSVQTSVAWNWNELSVLDDANEYFYEWIAQGRHHHTLAGDNGFYSKTNPLEALDWPTREEYERLVGFTREITGTYYYPHLRWKGAMYDYVYEGADYDETLKEAQQYLERYITE